MIADPPADFNQFGLPAPVIKALADVGYETPTPIQSQTIDMMMQGKDVLGQAQTGTGKTAAFALPALANIDLKGKSPQVLVLAPTRELAIQVAEAFGTYAKHLKGFHVLPVYGGQDYRVQTRALERGVHVIVGTPGRTMDHMRRGTLKLDQLRTLVLDEADEMLRMGFIDDVEWILEHTPKARQIALFSATMPTRIRKIASRHLSDPQHVTIKEKTATASTIRQRYCTVTHGNKLDALTRILEAEPVDGMIVFVRTRTTTVEVAEKLEARGYAAAALNGDIQQKQRERTIDNLKKGKLDILVATDVAARGLDVERISHVLNFDIPYDTEAYIHRIGRTGRAGREGAAILFVTPRERHLKNSIERASKTTIEQMVLPTNEVINHRRIARFKDQITETLSSQDLSRFEELVLSCQQDTGETPLKIAAAMAHLLQDSSPFMFPETSAHGKGSPRKDGHAKDAQRSNAPAAGSTKAPQEKPLGKFEKRQRENRQPVTASESMPNHSTTKRDGFTKTVPLEKGMERFRLEVGSNHDVKPSNIVGAIANEAGIDSEYIGRIVINDDYSLIDLPEGMPKEIFRDLKKTRVRGLALRISRDEESSHSGSAKSVDRKPAKKHKKDDDRQSFVATATGTGSGTPKERKKPKVKDKNRKDKGKPGSHRKKGSVAADGGSAPPKKRKSVQAEKAVAESTD